MFNEESLELMTIDLLKEQGYSYESGESIGRDYSEVILEYNLTCALFKINKGLNENIIAAVIPVAVKSNIPISIPTTPKLLALAKAPCISEWPKLVIGTIAPPPTTLIM